MLAGEGLRELVSYRANGPLEKGDTSKVSVLVVRLFFTLYGKRGHRWAATDRQTDTWRLSLKSQVEAPASFRNQTWTPHGCRRSSATLEVSQTTLFKFNLYHVTFWMTIADIFFPLLTLLPIYLITGSSCETCLSTSSDNFFFFFFCCWHDVCCGTHHVLEEFLLRVESL